MQLYCIMDIQWINIIEQNQTYVVCQKKIVVDIIKIVIRLYLKVEDLATF